MHNPNRISAILDSEANLEASYPEAEILLEAILENDEQLIVDLFDHRLDINIQDILGQSPLYLASNAWNLDLVKLFLSRLADPNLCDHEGNNSLHAICFRDDQSVITPKGIKLYSDIIRILVLYKVNINHRNNMGVTPLFVAATGNDLPAVQLLLQLGADVKIPDNEGQLPYMVTSNIEIRNLLLSTKKMII